jgi:long-chain acyl-CoA synthetase
MYPGVHAKQHPDRPCVIMAGSGEVITYAEMEARTNQLAHLLRARGLRRTDHYSIFMENNCRYVETCGAGERSGLYYTCVNSYLTADELAFIVNDSQSRAVITSLARREVAMEAMAQCPDVELFLIIEQHPEIRGVRAGTIRAYAVMPSCAPASICAKSKI